MKYTRDLLSAVPSLVPRAPRPDSTEPVVRAFFNRETL